MIVVLFTMKHDKWKVFIPATITMMTMHIISVGFGTLFPLLFSRNTIVYFSVFLFLFFGIMMIYEAYHLQPKTAEEKVEEIQSNLLARNDPESNKVKAETNAIEATERNNKQLTKAADSELSMEKAKNETKYFCTNPYLHLVVLLFLADWGDRCQIAAIVLTATHNTWGVAVGGALVI
jgi:putative Ca2+/H+ antiporter (TMEM165/GDT1 family)